MPEEQSESHRLANTISELLYAVAGWMLVGLGVLGIIVQTGYIVGDPMLADPVLTPAVVLISVVFVLFGVFVNLGFVVGWTAGTRPLILDEPGASTSAFFTPRKAEPNAVWSVAHDCIKDWSDAIERGSVSPESPCSPVLRSNYYCVDCATTEFENAPGDTVVEADDEPEQSPRPAMERR